MKELHTQRLRLEPLEARHAEAMFDGLRSEAAYEFITEAPPQTLELLRQRFTTLAQGRSFDGSEIWLNWAIWAIPEQRFVGYVQATIPSSERQATIAYLLFPDVWGRGYAREAVLSMVEHLITAYEVHDLRAYVDERNHRSIRLLLDLGFASHPGPANRESIDEGRTDELEFRKLSFQ